MHLPHPDAALALLAFFVFLAGFVDSIAGGGGLITIPAYMQYGLNLGNVLGTNKLSSSMGTAVAAFKFLSELSFRSGFLALLGTLALAGSVCGAALVSYLPPGAVRYLVIIFLPPAAFFIARRHSFGLADLSDAQAPAALRLKASCIAFFVSFYDGLFGPGTGTFLAVAFTRFCGYDLLKATALAKFLNLASNLAALATFIWFGRVDFGLGITLGIVGMAGNYAGAHVALKKGVWLIRPMIFLVANALLVKIVWDMLR